ncbi:O-antigen ligase family protein [Geodermatophilus sp. SYSU D00691]
MQASVARTSTVGATAVVAAAAGAGIIAAPSLTVGLGALLTVIGVLTWRPMLSVHAALWLAVTTFPSTIPYAVQVGPTTVYTYEPFLYVATAYVLWKYSPGLSALRRVGVLILVVVTAATYGFFRGHPVIEIIGDSRGLITVCAAMLVAAALMRAGAMPELLTSIKWSLWVSAVFTALGSSTGLPLNGRAESAALFISGAQEATAAVRLLTAATHFALAVLCACLAVMLTRRASIAAVAPYLVPALLITFLGFSRNAILALAVAVVVALVIERSSVTMAGLGRAALSAVVFAGVIGVLGAAHVPGADWASLQARAYYDRVVIGGLDDEVRRLDSSALSREAEEFYAREAIAESPIVGHGMGYAYRSGYGAADSFTATKGRYYIHNFYLWVWVKAGALGLLAWLYVTIPLLLRQAVHPTAQGTALAAAAAGLLAVCFVAPLPNGPDSSGAMTIGIVFGALATLQAYPREETFRPASVGGRLSTPEH